MSGQLQTRRRPQRSFVPGRGRGRKKQTDAALEKAVRRPRWKEYESRKNGGPGEAIQKRAGEESAKIYGPALEKVMPGSGPHARPGRRRRDVGGSTPADGDRQRGRRAPEEPPLVQNANHRAGRPALRRAPRPGRSRSSGQLASGLRSRDRPRILFALCDVRQTRAMSASLPRCRTSSCRGRRVFARVR